nr:hypothetical protein Iba_chr13dCG4050 [Ipomoea batatas]
MPHEKKRKRTTRLHAIQGWDQPFTPTEDSLIVRLLCRRSGLTLRYWYTRKLLADLLGNTGGIDILLMVGWGIPRQFGSGLTSKPLDKKEFNSGCVSFDRNAARDRLGSRLRPWVENGKRRAEGLWNGWTRKVPNRCWEAKLIIGPRWVSGGGYVLRCEVRRGLRRRRPPARGGSGRRGRRRRSAASRYGLRGLRIAVAVGSFGARGADWPLTVVWAARFGADWA